MTCLECGRLLVSTGAEAVTWPERLGSTRAGRHDLARPIERIAFSERRQAVAA